jgi:hypothetical protein
MMRGGGEPRHVGTFIFSPSPAITKIRIYIREKEGLKEIDSHGTQFYNNNLVEEVLLYRRSGGEYCGYKGSPSGKCFQIFPSTCPHIP